MLTLPQGMSRERESLLRLYGARVEVTESLGGMSEAVEAARDAGAATTTFSCPTSSPTRPTPRPIAARPARRSSVRSTAVWTCSSPASAPAARSPASGEYLRERNPELRRSWPSSRAARRCSRAGRRDRIASRGSARASSRRCSTASCSTRSSPCRDDDAIDTACDVRETRGPARRDLLRRRAVGAPCRSPHARSPAASGSS